MFITRHDHRYKSNKNVLKLICQLFTKGVVSHRKRLKTDPHCKQFGIFNVKSVFIFRYWLYYELIQKFLLYFL